MNSFRECLFFHFAVLCYINSGNRWNDAALSKNQTVNGESKTQPEVMEENGLLESK
jgi:hypothetical protein